MSAPGARLAPRLELGRFAISDFQIGESQIVIRLGLVRLDARRIFIRGNRRIEPAREEVCVAEFVVSFGGVGP